MQDIEQRISPLIENMFPSFYKDEGQNFIMFVKAYYEWLETNHQVLQLVDNTNFNVGDIITQEQVTGTIIAYVGTDILVKVDGLETFKCFGVCSDLIPVTSSSGGSTFILKGGATRRLGNIFLSRNLPNIRDIDTTLDLFITQFKEKYLKNIEFETESNKRMLVKNSLDLYRSKGTSRSIDLFFRLVYGYNSEVFYPGDHLFKLSEGQWIKPRYIEITGTNPQRAVALVGTTIVGVTSGAEAFVEKYIKRKVNDGFVHILYLTNVRGEFVNRETVYHKHGSLYSDSPNVLGSLTSVDILTGSREFNVGDIVTFVTATGDYGKARVVSVYDDERGVVDFILLEGGYGYSISNGITGTEALKRTQSLVTDNTILVSNVYTSNSISGISILTAGSSYSNNDTITISSEYGRALFRPITNTSGGIIQTAIMSQSGGFFGNTYTANIATSTGTSGSVMPVFKESYVSSFFKVFEDVRQNRATIVYSGIANGYQFSTGDVIRVANSTSYDVAYGEIIDNNVDLYSNGQIDIAVGNNYSIVVGDRIHQIANSLVIANVSSVSNTTAIGGILDVSSTANMYIDNMVGNILVGDEIYQIDEFGYVVGRANVAVITSQAANYILNITNVTGFFKIGKTIYVTGTEGVSAKVNDVSFYISVYGTTNDYHASQVSKIFGTQTGTIADITTVSVGTGANFKVGTLSETETIYVNDDLVESNNYPTVGANQAFTSIRLNANTFGFKQNPSGNVSSNIFSCLSFANLSIGIIKTITGLEPGSNYSAPPITKAYQPYVANYDYNDYILTVKDATNQFIVGEQVQQTISDLRYNLTVGNPQKFRVGEKVFQYSTGAVGTVFSVSYPTSNVIVVNKVSNGVFAATGNLYSYSTSNTSNVSVVSSITVPTTAKGLVIGVVDANTVYVKRIQFENKFILNSTITGTSTGGTANLIQVDTYTDRNPIGFNAEIESSTYSANGVITSLQVIDSGYGYSNNQSLVYTSEDGSRTGTARAIVSGSGTGSGYYKTSKGFLSNISKVHDGDYYQEYSYDVMSRIPLDKYGAMFKKVMHTAGTRLFGTVVIDTVSNTNVNIANSTFEIIV